MIDNDFHGYVCFLDADDYLTNNAEHIFDKYVNTLYDVVYLGVEGREDISGELSHNADYVVEALQRASKDYCDELRYNVGPCWGRLYSIDFIAKHEIQFADAICCEDTWFSAMCGYYAKNIILDIEKSFYVYVNRKGSIVNSHMENKLKDSFRVNYDLTLWLREHTRVGYGYMKGNLMYHWIAWGQFDLQALRYMGAMLNLYSKEEVIMGIRKMAKRRVRRIISNKCIMFVKR